jgi:chemotaxis signal transduction protein
MRAIASKGTEKRGVMSGFDLQPGHSHCVFRRGTSWFALPALSVREVLQRPAIVVVPNAGPPLTGLCHVRSEFLPVLNLGPLLGEDSALLPNEAQMLVVVSTEGTWGLLVDQVAALTSLEISVAPEGSSTSWFATVLGWATYREQVVRVLEPTTYYRLAELALEGAWAGRHDEYRDGYSSTQRGSVPSSSLSCQTQPVAATAESITG